VTHNPQDIDIGDSTSYDGGPSFGDIPGAAGRDPVACRLDARSTFVVVTLGQSNAANFAGGIYIADTDVVNFNIYDGKCYRAVDPLLGASGLGGNFATRLGDVLVRRGYAARVVIAPIAMGNTRIEHWSFGGIFHKRILFLIRRLWDADLVPDVILWQQGEGNAADWDLAGRRYARRLLEIVRTFREYGIAAPFMIALCTICGPPHPNPLKRVLRAFWRTNIRAGQRRAAKRDLDTLLGPDTDLIGYGDRFDLCHMSESGAQKQAEMWADAIIQHIKAPTLSAAR
jgi:Carbohydrate esterase, sialic acid-specific acetylesterase